MPKKMHVILRAGESSNYGEVLCDNVVIGSRNVVFDDGRILLPHGDRPILISFKEVDEDESD